MYIELRDLVLMNGDCYCGALNKPFAILFGNRMELTPQNLDKLIERSDLNPSDLFGYLLDALSEDYLKELARYLKIEFCSNCWDLYIMPDRVSDALESLSKHRQLLAIIDLAKLTMKDLIK